MPEKRKAPPKAAPDERVVSVRLGRETHQRARLYSVRSDKTLGAIIDEALVEYLKKHGA
jgi:hypothetical protein